MNRIQRYLKIFPAIVVLVMLLNLALPFTVFAQDVTTPADTPTAPVVTDAPTEIPINTPTDTLTTSTEVIETPVSTDVTQGTSTIDPSTVAPTEEPTAIVTITPVDPTNPGTDLLDVTNALIDAAQIVSNGDPYIIRNNITYRFMPLGGCPVSPVDPNCFESITPIQSAVNFALTGESVVVASGTYAEQVIISKTINLVGEPGATLNIPYNFGPGLTSIDHNEGWGDFRDFPYILIDGSLNPGISVGISGFQINGPDPSLWNIPTIDQIMAIAFNNSSGTVQDNTITGFYNQHYQNSGVESYGVGVEVMLSNNVTISHNNLSNNQNAIEIEHSHDISICNNQINNNYFPIDGGDRKSVV
jgi:hypothetical protein